MEIHRLILSSWANGAYSLFGTNIELCRSTSNGNTWSKRTTKAAIPLHLRNFRCSEAPTSPKYPLHFRDIFGTSDKSLGILLEQYQNMSKISEQSPEPSLVLDYEPWLNCRAFTEIAPSRGHSGHTEVWLSSAADSSSALCQDFFTGLGEAFIERRKDSVLLRLFRELLEPRWWPGALR